MATLPPETHFPSSLQRRAPAVVRRDVAGGDQVRFPNVPVGQSPWLQCACAVELLGDFLTLLYRKALASFVGLPCGQLQTSSWHIWWGRIADNAPPRAMALRAFRWARSASRSFA